MLTETSRSEQFPLLNQMTYLNTAAEGIPPLAVGAAYQDYFKDLQFGMDGRRAHYARHAALRESAGRLLGLCADEIGICSCTSEAYNLVSMAIQLQSGDEVVINDLDYPAGTTPWMQLVSPATVKIWRSREGALRVEDLLPLLGPRTRLVCASLVSFYNGFKVPLAAIVDAIRQHSSALFSLDVTQALGRINFDINGVDLVISSTHKWVLGPHGGGIVGVPACRSLEWTVPAGGWFNLKDAFGPGRFDAAPERKPGAASFMVGMPNFGSVYAVHAAIEYINAIGVTAIAAVADPLVAACVEELQKLPVDLLTPNEPDALAGILAFRHAAADAIHEQLRANNIHVMNEVGRIRLTFHGYNTAADVEKFLSILSRALASV